MRDCQHDEQKGQHKTTKNPPQCTGSKVFAMFDQSQTQEFKEALEHDQNRDDVTDRGEAHKTPASLGKIQLMGPWAP